MQIKWVIILMISALASAFLTLLVFLVLKPDANYVMLVATIIQIIIVLSLFILYLKQANTRVGARRILLFSAIPSFSLPLAYIAVLGLFGGKVYSLSLAISIVLIIGAITTTFSSIGLMIIQSVLKDFAEDNHHEPLDS